MADCAVDAAAVPGAELGRPVLEDIELGFELGEDEDFVLSGEEERDEAVEEEHFARCCDERVVDGAGVVAPGPVEVVRGVAGEARLENRVLHFLLGDLFFCEFVLVG